MTTLADRTIAALRRTHNDLAALVPTLSAAQLQGPSGASEWSIAQVLSHLGSGAEIATASYRSAINATPAPGQDFNQSVWDRWNAMSPAEQSAGFVEYDATLLALLEELSPTQRETLEVKLGFLPAPLPLASILGMRLNETALHQWDVRVALDPAATVDAEAAAVIVDHFTGGLGFLLGFIAKADQVAEPASVHLEGSEVTLVVDEGVGLQVGATEPTATFTGSLEELTRLIGGRLAPEHTSVDTTVTGNVTLDDLRRVFPGY